MADKNWFGKFLRIVFPIAISAIAFWLVFRKVDTESLLKAFRNISAGQLFFYSITFLIGLVLRVWSWYLILRKQFTFKRVFFVMNAGYLLNNVFPFRLGEIGRAILLGSSEEGKPGKIEVLSSIVIERIYDVFLASVFFLSCLPLVVVSTSGKVLAILTLVIILAIFILIIWLTYKRAAINAWMERYEGKAKKVVTWLKPKLDVLLKGFSVFQNKKLFVLSFFLMLISWVFSMIQQTPLRMVLMPDGQWWWVVFVLASGAFAAALPSAPASLGVFEAAIVGSFALLGVGQSEALAYALIVHAIQFVFSALFGALGLMVEGQSIGNLYKKARQQKTVQ